MFKAQKDTNNFHISAQEREDISGKKLTFEFTSD